MIGFPTETKEEMVETIEIIKQLERDNKNAMLDALNMFTPHKCTPLFNDALKLGLKEPQRLEEWQDWLFRGNNKSNWLSARDRSFIENACDTSIYYGNVRRVFGSINNPIMRATLKILMFLPEKYFKLKWEHNWFGLDPAFALMRLVRKLFRIEV
jgi:radical SAM superfamily enzyme YgiQ (UPF0313 family)